MEKSATSDFLGESLNRLDRYKADLENCDASTRIRLLSAWKEQVIRDLVQLLISTDDPALISNVDRAIALAAAEELEFRPGELYAFFDFSDCGRTVLLSNVE